MEKTISLNDSKALISSLVKVPVEVVDKLGFVDEATEIFCFCPSLDERGNVMLEGSSRNGYIILCGPDGGVLYYGGTAMSYSQVIEEYQKGRRTPLDDFGK